MAKRLEGRYHLPARQSSVRLAFLFVSENPKGREVPFHTHEALELVYYAEGEGRSTVADAPNRIARNSFTITPSGVRHDQCSRSDLTSVCLGLSQSGLEDIQGCWQDREGVLRRPIEVLLREVEMQGLAFETVCEGLVLEIVGLARRVAEAAPVTSSKQAVVHRALDMIQAREGDLSVGELSEQLFVSKDYLRHLFKEYTSQSPLRHIINTRIDKARNLLGRLDLTIGQIAAQCGFDNHYYFSRLFKQVTGQTPSEYRRTIGA